MFGTINHEAHRLRRSAVAPFFSSASMRKVEPLIQDKISLLISVFRRYQSTGEILHIRPAFSALTSDVITEYCFGISENYIEAKEFNAMVLETTDKLTDNMHVTVQWPRLPIWLNKLPDRIVGGIFGEGMATFQVLKRVRSDPLLPQI
jgi:cytochrome P450